MEKYKRIREVVKGMPTIEGGGVHLKRTIGSRGEMPEFDPFLLLDEFSSDNPRQYSKGFPWHPHRGMETITLVLDGEIQHQDSMGNTGVIGPGGVQWMTAGSGIIHQEMPRGNEEGRIRGLQLWSNLPAREKMMTPRYRDIQSNDIPVVTVDDGVKIRVIAGRVANAQGPVRDVISQPELLDITVPADTEFTYPAIEGYTVFAYVLDGQGYFNPDKGPYEYISEGKRQLEKQQDALIGPAHAILFGDGERVAISTENEPLRFLLISGKPIREPVAWRGPVVMNTQEELEQAFYEIRHDTFVKVGKKPVEQKK